MKITHNHPNLFSVNYSLKGTQLITVTGNYSDENGNIIEAPEGLENIQVSFKGKNNKLIIKPNNKIKKSKIFFTGDNSICLIQQGCRFIGSLRVSHDCLILLGSNVSCTNSTTILAAEKTFVVVGDDVMIASNVTIRSDDAHAIYDVESGDRLNLSKSIIIGYHTWLADQAVILSNSKIGDGSIVGTKALAKGVYSNNSLIVGIPAKSVKSNVAWERPHLAIGDKVSRTNAKKQNLINTSAAWNKTDPKRKEVVVGEQTLSLLRKYKPLLSHFDFSYISGLGKIDNKLDKNKATPLCLKLISNIKKLFK